VEKLPSKSYRWFLLIDNGRFVFFLIERFLRMDWLDSKILRYKSLLFFLLEFSYRMVLESFFLKFYASQILITSVLFRDSTWISSGSQWILSVESRPTFSEHFFFCLIQREVSSPKFHNTFSVLFLRRFCLNGSLLSLDQILWNSSRIQSRLHILNRWKLTLLYNLNYLVIGFKKSTDVAQT